MHILRPETNHPRWSNIVKNRPYFLISLTSILLSVAILGGCTRMTTVASAQPETNPDGSIAEPAPGFTQFPDLPFPPGSQMDIESTFIVGSNDSWYGQTSITTKLGSNNAFDFYKQRLPDHGWVELSSVRAQTSILTYTREHRVLAIQLVQGNLATTDVLITVSPKDGVNNTIQ